MHTYTLVVFCTKNFIISTQIAFLLKKITISIAPLKILLTFANEFKNKKTFRMKRFYAYNFFYYFYFPVK